MIEHTMYETFDGEKFSDPGVVKRYIYKKVSKCLYTAHTVVFLGDLEALLKELKENTSNMDTLIDSGAVKEYTVYMTDGGRIFENRAEAEAYLQEQYRERLRVLCTALFSANDNEVQSRVTKNMRSFSMLKEAIDELNSFKSTKPINAIGDVDEKDHCVQDSRRRDFRDTAGSRDSSPFVV